MIVRIKVTVKDWTEWLLIVMLYYNDWTVFTYLFLLGMSPRTIYYYNIYGPQTMFYEVHFKGFVGFIVHSPPGNACRPGAYFGKYTIPQDYVTEYLIPWMIFSETYISPLLRTIGKENFLQRSCPPGVNSIVLLLTMVRKVLPSQIRFCLCHMMIDKTKGNSTHNNSLQNKGQQ